MDKNNSTKTVVSYTFCTWLAVLGAILASILSVVGWTLSIMWPNIENLEINFLVLLTIGDIVWILVLLGIYERLTLSGQLLTQVRSSGRRASVDLSRLVFVEPIPISKRSTGRPSRLSLKDSQGNQLELYGSKFRRNHFQFFLTSIREAIANQHLVQEKDRDDIEQILEDWENKPSASRKLFIVAKYITTCIVIVLLTTTLSMEVSRALAMHTGCEKIRSEQKTTMARVDNIALAYDSNGGRYNMREYPTNDINKATTLYLTVGFHFDGKDSVSKIRAHGGTPEERISLYNKAKQGAILVIYSPVNPEFVVLANTTHSDFKVCNYI